MKRIVVTGATGMIGLSFIEEALLNGLEIFAVIRPDSPKRSLLPKSKNISIVECEVSSYNRLSELIIEPCDAFYHFAWTSTGSERNTNIKEQIENIRFTIDALQSAKNLGCKKFIGAGSQAEFGKNSRNERFSPDSLCEPSTPYGITKFTAGKLAAIEAFRLGLDFFWVRIFSVYGKYDRKSSMISSTLEKLLNNRRPSFTAGIQLWDYIFCEDVGRAFYLIGQKSQGNKVYCLGSGKARPLSEYIKIMRNAVNPNLEIGLGEIPYTNDSIMNLCADINSLTADTGFLPQISFENGIKKTIDWMKADLYEEKNINSNTDI